MIVALLTDFGTRDYFVAAMKGVILSQAPAARLVDVSHEIRAHDVGEAAFILGACYRDFPGGTVFLVVVDPGVGSRRRPLAGRAGAYFFVGPDNGVFSRILEREADADFRNLDGEGAAGSVRSATFHGRDLFAPAAAQLARQGELGDLGTPITDPTRLPAARPPAMDADGALHGFVVHVDRFGNCVTSFEPSDFPSSEWTAFEFRVGRHRLTESRTYYAESERRGPFVILGSAGFLEIAIGGESAANALDLHVGDPCVAVSGRSIRGSAGDSRRG